jgi:hypothetical protein
MLIIFLHLQSNFSAVLSPCHPHLASPAASPPYSRPLLTTSVAAFSHSSSSSVQYALSRITRLVDTFAFAAFRASIFSTTDATVQSWEAGNGHRR